jgi:hypothetical protein
MSSVAGGPSTVGFLGASAASAPRLRAFTANGALWGRDAGVDVRVASVDVAAGRLAFQYKLSFLSTYSAEVAVAYGGAYSDRARAYHLRPDPAGGNAPADRGVFVFFELLASDLVAGPAQAVFAGDAYYFNVSNNEGKSFVASDGNTPHAVIECAGRGVCDRASGACACAPGYTGDACQRSSCPNDCSGSGHCRTERAFVEEGTLGALAYTAVDAGQQTGCKCDAGFRGADCSLRECPSADDPLGGDGGAQGRDCSGRGNCDYTSGQCACFAGYAGATAARGRGAARARARALLTSHSPSPARTRAGDHCQLSQTA